MEKIFHANGDQKKAEVAILISDKIDFKNCYKRYGRTIHDDQEAIIIINIYAPNI